MVDMPQIRGAILEEIVLILMEKAGYRVLDASEGEGLSAGHSGLDIQGRGEKHQVDALVSYDYTPSFIFPIRLIVEAKAYKKPVGIEVVRNAVGVLADVNQNYFSFTINPGTEIKQKRFNYSYAVFSLNGFTANAQRYAIAHQIFLIQYYYTPLFNEIRLVLERFPSKIEHLEGDHTSLQKIRAAVRNLLKGEFVDKSEEEVINRMFMSIEIMKIKEAIDNIRGSYFGLLNGVYPIHLLSEKSLVGIGTEDEYFAEVFVTGAKYVSLNFNGNKLFFELPEDIANTFKKVWGDKEAIAQKKGAFIKFVSLSGLVDGIRRNLKIKLDGEWLNDYLEKIRTTKKEVDR